MQKERWTFKCVVWCVSAHMQRHAHANRRHLQILTRIRLRRVLLPLRLRLHPTESCLTMWNRCKNIQERRKQEFMPASQLLLSDVWIEWMSHVNLKLRKHAAVFGSWCPPLACAHLPSKCKHIQDNVKLHLTERTQYIYQCDILRNVSFIYCVQNSMFCLWGKL